MRRYGSERLRSPALQAVDDGSITGEVTIYGNNTSSLTCSATTVQVAEEKVCYNSSWIYIVLGGDEMPC